MHPLLLVFTVALGSYAFAKLLERKSTFAPGPKPVPLLGNIFDFTSKELWLRVHAWAKAYGGIINLRVLGMNIVFINDADIAFELLEKRGSIYSSKPRLVMVGEMCGCEDMIPFLPYNQTFKQRRRLMQQTLGPRSIPKYYELFQIETKRFIHSLLTDPDNYLRHIRRYSGGLTLSVVYGYDAKSSNDKYLLLAEESMSLLANEMAPGTGLWAVDVLPFLRYLPSWFPGAQFKQKARIWKKKMQEFVNAPYAEAKANMAAGTILPSFCQTHFDGSSLTPQEEDHIKFTANSMYAASADTTISTVSHLILAMIYHPSEFKKAKEEMDRVIGKERLPTFDDRASLPYLECVLSEIWRWGAPVPLNLPHLVQQDDEYRGYTIPKGSLVIANMWTMLRNEDVYEEPDAFKPERFLPRSDGESDAIDPKDYIFGFGRRRCPGADLVNSSIWLLMATMVATIDICKRKNPDGSILEPEIEFDNLFFRTPKAFKFAVTSHSNLLDLE